MATSQPPISIDRFREIVTKNGLVVSDESLASLYSDCFTLPVEKQKPQLHQCSTLGCVSTFDPEKESYLRSDLPKNYVMFPIDDDDRWRMYKQAVASFWVAEEISLGNDKFDDLTENEQFFIKRILAFFASSDFIVMDNLSERFSREVKSISAGAFYGFQTVIEQIHSETYALLLLTYVKNRQERDMLFNAIEEIPAIKKKAQWCEKWIQSETATFPERLIAFACVEGIFFSGAFCSIFWLKKRGIKLQGLCFANELISRDEALHLSFATLLYNQLEQKLCKERVYEIVKEAVDYEIEFIIESLPCDLIGMNQGMMSEYIQHVSDYLLTMINVPKLFNVQNPFPWMELISLSNKANFFERQNSDYAKSGVMASLNKRPRTEPSSEESKGNSGEKYSLEFDEDV